MIILNTKLIIQNNLLISFMILFQGQRYWSPEMFENLVCHHTV